VGCRSQLDTLLVRATGKKEAIVVPHYNRRRFCDTQLPVTADITEIKKLNKGIFQIPQVGAPLLKDSLRG